MLDLAIIGGGAAGLAAAVSAGRCGVKTAIIERNEAPGKKILTTGGGRCNFTNMNLGTADYYDCNKEFIGRVLDAFGPEDALLFMYGLGIMPVLRNGYAYPMSEEASSVRDALVRACQSTGVAIHNNSGVLNITKQADGFHIATEGYTYTARKLIIACGGKASPATGSCGDGYAWAQALGHRITGLYPGLTGICFDSPLKKAAGVRVNAALTLNCGSGTYREQGEIQINDYGISGIPVMSLSRIAAGSDSCTLTIDFLPAYTEEELDNIRLSCGLRGLLPSKLAAVIPESADIKAYKVVPTGVKGYDSAHVTRGGVSTDEIDPLSMESRLVPGLHFAGEIIDIDGRCGGYNLHFAWASGVIAGTGAASGSQYIRQDRDPQLLELLLKSEIGSRRA